MIISFTMPSSISPHPQFLLTKATLQHSRFSHLCYEHGSCTTHRYMDDIKLNSSKLGTQE